MVRIRKRSGIAVIITTVLVAACLGSVLWLFLYPAYEARHYRVLLLCRTDHEALLRACRELSRQVMSGELQNGSYAVRGGTDEGVEQFPGEIRALRPTQVIIDTDGSVDIDMAGPFDVFGAHAYPEDYREPAPDFKYGDRELVKGLWYYDEGYRFDPNYDKKVAAMLIRCGKLKKPTRQ